jgi:HK97 family phage portal protein
MAFSTALAKITSVLNTQLTIPTLNQARPPMPTVQVTEAIARLTQLTGGVDRQPIIPALTLAQASREAYEISHFVHGCLSKIATAISSVPWGLEKRDGKSRQFAPVPDSDYEMLLERPNPYMNGQKLFERWALHLQLTGNCIGLKVRPLSGSRTAPTEIWPIQPDFIKPVPDQYNYLSHYEFQSATGRKIPINPNDVIHIMVVDPRNPHWGLSPLIALGRVIATEVDALNWWRQSIRNRASKLGVMSFPHTLNDEQYDEVYQQLIAQATGPWNAGLPWVVGTDAKWVAASNSPQEMDFIGTRKMTREEICGALGTSPILMGIMDAGSYNNMATARLMFWLDTVVPMLNNFRAALDLDLLPDFFPTSQLRSYQTNYDLTNVDALVFNLVNLITVAKELFAMGVPFEQINARLKLGFTEFPGWSISWLRNALIPADQLAEHGPKEYPVGSELPDFVPPEGSEEPNVKPDLPSGDTAPKPKPAPVGAVKPPWTGAPSPPSKSWSEDAAVLEAMSYLSDLCTKMAEDLATSSDSDVDEAFALLEEACGSS